VAIAHACAMDDVRQLECTKKLEVGGWAAARDIQTD
jgi:hypothetical protein